MPASVIAVQEPECFYGLKQEWDALAARDRHASLFSTFDFVRVAWDHFHGPDDRLLVLTLRRNGQLQAVVPLRQSVELLRGIPLRILRYIAEWEGDRPGIVSVIPRADVWRVVQFFLSTNFKAWDALVLAEQSAETAASQITSFTGDPGLRIEAVPDAVGYSVSLSGSWEQYFNGLGSELRKTYRKRLRHLEQVDPAYRVEQYERPECIAAALERFMTVEQRGRKKEAAVGVTKSERVRGCYEELLPVLARNGRAIIYCLSAAGKDIASAIAVGFQGRWYGLQIAFDPDYAGCSPGMLLQCALLKSLFGGPWLECDLLAMLGPQPHKASWATQRHDTVRLTVFRKWSRALPLLWGRRVKRLIAGSPVRDEIAAFRRTLASASEARLAH